MKDEDEEETKQEFEEKPIKKEKIAETQATQEMDAPGTPPTQSLPSTQETMEPHQPQSYFTMFDDAEASQEEDESKPMDSEEEKEEKLANSSESGQIFFVCSLLICFALLIILQWVPYSLHSSYLELSEFVRLLKPRRITPLVHNTFDPNTYFTSFLDKSPVLPLLLFMFYYLL